MALSNIYLSIITKPNIAESEYQYMFYSLCAIQGASILGDIEGCNLLVKVFNETVVNPSKIIDACFLFQSCCPRPFSVKVFVCLSPLYFGLILLYAVQILVWH